MNSVIVVDKQLLCNVRQYYRRFIDEHVTSAVRGAYYFIALYCVDGRMIGRFAGCRGLTGPHRHQQTKCLETPIFRLSSIEQLLPYPLNRYAVCFAAEIVRMVFTYLYGLAPPNHQQNF